MTLWGGEAMAAGVSRCGWTRQPWRVALIAPAFFTALAMLAGAGAAQEADGGGKDTDQAIEITADTLEVRQSDNVAIFQGDVNAEQGEMVLKSDVLTVYYREVQGGEGNLGVSRIDAEGSVVITSPDETAMGQHGVYDVEAGRIDLAGGVTLIRGNNVIKGETLVMDLESGVSRVVGEDGERVRGLFVPGDEEE